MKTMHKFLVIYDLMNRKEYAVSFLRPKGKKHKLEVVRADEFQTFTDETHLYTFIEGVKGRNVSCGYPRIVIKRIFSIASEMDATEFNAFYEEHSAIWYSSHAGMAVTGDGGKQVSGEILIDHAQVEADILSKGTDISGNAFNYSL